jgi:hypothetical protein
MTVNSTIKIGSAFDTTKFVLGDVIDEFNVEILPKVTTKQRLALGKTLTPTSAGFKVYDTTKKIRYFWNLTDWVPQNETVASGLTINTELSPSVVDTSHSAPPIAGQVLTATSSTTAEWLTPASGTTIGTGDLSYTYTQIIASSIWNVTHGLNKHPSVTVIDSAGTVVIGDIQYIDANNLILTFTGAFSGKAYLN